jgi:hypothetical protein
MSSFWYVCSSCKEFVGENEEHHCKKHKERQVSYVTIDGIPLVGSFG